ncbi:MAG: hypothetical protein IOC80_00140 [Rhodobacter sp.]|nr:hypothetical protein [Rhodobacter sp.]MCA3514175.1 hypothetical protein [Rhodobacter sp.]MCA3519323.1 hypothetical protein [Rhodobacter sp.]MCA3523301.1 hypothetical protein [Rhodobacter sp.]MCA3525546.1 hypothetical protein [Rhodobacter sp.]
MTDNVTLPATAEVVATDDVGGIHFQRVKLDGGGNGLSAPIMGYTGVPDNLAIGLPVRQVGEDIWNCSFSDVGSGLIAPEMSAEIMGTGVGASQAGGALAITTGTTANAEFLARSLQSWRGSLRARFSTVLSQRIANQNFALLLADLLLEGASITINSATSITVNWPEHPFTAQSVGQFLLVGGIVGAAGVPGRYAIASVIPGTSFNLTVAGWPASGTCTATLFGHSYIRTLFSGTTATAAAVDTQRRGWAAGDSTITINSTASPGTIMQVESDGRAVYFSDTLRATSVTPNVTTRGSRIENLPDDNLDLYLFIWSYNGSTAPASTTTWTISFASVEKYANIPVYVQGQRAQGSQNAAPVAVVGTPAVSISGTPAVTVSSGAVAAAGPAAHDAAISGNPVRVAGRAMTANYTPVASGDVADALVTTVGALIEKPYCIPEQEWGASLALTTTTATQIQAAAAAGLKRHMTSLWAINTGAAVVDLIILDGATERHRYPLPVNVPVAVVFPTGIVLTAATALNANLSAAGTVHLNAHGYTAP